MMSPAGANRELVAIVVNLREERCLQKCLQTIDMERKYSSKVFELDLRILKVYLKGLRERISHIKSNLTAEEICQVRELEAQEKLGNHFPSAVSTSALKIAAAYRCLKLEPNITLQEVSKLAVKNFLFGQDESILSSISSEESAEEMMQIGRGENKISSLSALLNTSKRRNSVRLRPATSVLSKRDKQTAQITRPKTAPIPPDMKFSSHIEYTKPSSIDYLQNTETTWQTEFDSDIAGCHFGEHQSEEKRKRCLQSEVNKCKDLNNKTKNFLDNLDSFVSASEKNTRLYLNKASTDDTLFRKGMLSPKNKQLRKSQQAIHFNSVVETKPTEDHQEKPIKVWKDLNKCRYLRVSDDMLDLSGVVTLAKDHMKQMSNLHNL
ncbi:uncharacterized protein LOC106878482 [Octopus bimaculoides]|uniref:Uncharacterized protein n=1 Tax=Octopus bimaculoides TaxID=37653 RepID=A0A0L8I9Y1_OCTBM|nr:uncharacterized protein LOC106878482 [Octopus bimaculoides]|eukprot:XP_014783191.1 PREDICTED: uncharacterized protein LOC106878482 [Octopus bimaculoides]